MSDASYYQQHKDDAEEWGEAVDPPRPTRQRLSAIISVRVTPEEEELLRERARSEGRSLSELIRKAVLARTVRLLEPGGHGTGTGSVWCKMGTTSGMMVLPSFTAREGDEWVAIPTDAVLKGYNSQSLAS